MGCENFLHGRQFDGDQAINFTAFQPKSRGFNQTHRPSTSPLGSCLLVGIPIPKMMHFMVLLMKKVEKWKNS